METLSTLFAMIKVVLLACWALYSVHSFAWESSGGGDAVVCFKHQESALSLDLQLEDGIPVELRDDIESVVTLEYWEYHDEPNLGGLSPANLDTLLHYNKDFKHYFIKKDNGTAEDYLVEARSLLKDYAPMFFQRLVIAHELIHPTKWINNPKLKPVNDSTPQKVIKKDSPCRLVQLAVRKAVSELGKVPKVSIEVDMDLYIRMDTLNQAMLAFHEEYYLLGKEIGHINSDMLRFEVARMFSSSTHVKYVMFPPEEISQGALDFQERIARIYGDYANIFNEDPVFMGFISNQKSSQQQRQLSFISLIKKLSKANSDCKEQGQFKNGQCMDIVFTQQLPSGVIKLTDEEAFVFLGRWFIDRLGFLIRTSENFMVWDIKNPLVIDDVISNELIQTCRFISDLTNLEKTDVPALNKIREFPFVKLFPNLLGQSKAYCVDQVLK